MEEQRINPSLSANVSLLQGKGFSALSEALKIFPPGSFSPSPPPLHLRDQPSQSNEA